MYTSAFLSKPAAIPIGLSISWLNNLVFKRGSFLFSSNIFETKLSLRDWFKLIYEVVFGDENGPRMGFFISFFGVNETKELIISKLK